VSVSLPPDNDRQSREGIVSRRDTCGGLHKTGVSRALPVWCSDDSQWSSVRQVSIGADIAHAIVGPKGASQVSCGP